MSAPVASQRKAWLFTYPHCDAPKEEVMTLLLEHPKLVSAGLKYMVICEEKHQNGEQHLHAYVHLEAPIRISQRELRFMYDILSIRTKYLTKDLAEEFDYGFRWCDATDDYGCGEDIIDNDKIIRRFHPNVESCRSLKKSIAYVKKHGNYITYGICPIIESMTRGEKNKLLLETSLPKLVDSGEISLYKITALKKAIETYKNECQRQNFEKKIVEWYYGETGTGKTKEAWARARDFTGIEEEDDRILEEVWISNESSKWFDGYHGQTVAILDDIRPGNWDFSTMLRLLDRYPLQVPIKGGYTRWIPKLIIITAPAEPRELYSNHETKEPYDGIEQLERRIDRTREFIKEPNPEEQEEITSFNHA